MTKESLVEQERTFKPAFTADTERRYSHQAKSQARVVGKAALGELHEEIPSVEWQSVARLVEAPRRHVSPVAERKIDRALHLLPNVASAVANRADPAVEFVAPTLEQVKSASLGARIISEILNLPVIRWLGFGKMFDDYIVDVATRKIKRSARRVVTFIESMSSIKRPKEQFMDELIALYEQIRASSSAPKRDRNQLTNIVLAVYGRRSLNGRGQSWYDPSDYPLVSGTLAKALPAPTIAHESGSLQRAAVRVATPEIIKGIEIFLNRHGRRVEPIVDTHKPILTRRAAEKFNYTRNKLESVIGRVVESLEDAHAALPENGETFAQSVVGLSKKIVELFMQGHSGQEIADKLRKDVWPKKRASP